MVVTACILVIRSKSLIPDGIMRASGRLCLVLRRYRNPCVPSTAMPRLPGGTRSWSGMFWTESSVYGSEMIQKAYSHLPALQNTRLTPRYDKLPINSHEHRFWRRIADPLRQRFDADQVNRIPTTHKIINRINSGSQTCMRYKSGCVVSKSIVVGVSAPIQSNVFCSTEPQKLKTQNT